MEINGGSPEQSTQEWALEIYKSQQKQQNIQAIFGLVVLIGIFGGCVANMTSPNPVSESRPGGDYESPEYTRSVIERSGVGETIDSVEEIVNACMVMAQDKGMTYSQAYNYCY